MSDPVGPNAFLALIPEFLWEMSTSFRAKRRENISRRPRGQYRDDAAYRLLPVRPDLQV